MKLCKRTVTHTRGSLAKRERGDTANYQWLLYVQVQTCNTTLQSKW